MTRRGEVAEETLTAKRTTAANDDPVVGITRGPNASSDIWWKVGTKACVLGPLGFLVVPHLSRDCGTLKKCHLHKGRSCGLRLLLKPRRQSQQEPWCRPGTLSHITIRILLSLFGHGIGNGEEREDDLGELYVDRNLEWMV